MSNEKDIQGFDELFKQGLENGTSPVPPGVWEGVSSVTSGAATTGSALSGLLGVKGAAILGGVAVIVAGIVYTTKDDTKTPNASDKNITQNQETTTKTEQEGQIANYHEEQAQQDAQPIESHPTEVTREESSAAVNTNATDGIVSDESPLDQTTSPDSKERKSPQTVESDREVQTRDLTLLPENASLCKNEAKTFTLGSTARLKSVVWKLNGKVVSKNQYVAEILFNEPGTQYVVIDAEFMDGTQKTLKSTVNIGKGSAGFTTENTGNLVTATAKHPVHNNKWYVNNVLYRSNVRQIEFEAETSEIQIAHVARNLSGCVDSVAESIVLEAVEDCDVTIRINDLTPYLQDGVHDEMVVEMPEVQNYRLTVYNPSNGNIVFETKEQTEYWNGRYQNKGALVPVGVYIYQITYTCSGDTVSRKDKVWVTNAKN